MEADFWLDRWQQGRTGWQERQPGAMLVRHFGALGLGPGALVLVPLCGATPSTTAPPCLPCRRISAVAMPRIWWR